MAPKSSRTRSIARLALTGAILLPALLAPVWAETIGDDDERTIERRRVYVYRGIGDLPMVLPGLSANRTYLGVQLVNLTSELLEHFGAASDAGVMVSQVVRESPAESAGIRVGDILVSVDGKPIASAGRLSREIAAREEGNVVTLEIWRDGRLETVAPTLAARKRTQVDVRPFLWHWRDDGEGLRDLSPDDEIEGHIQIDSETLDEALENLHQHLGSDSWKGRMRFLQEHGDSVLERLEELEDRLQRLEQELDELPRDDS